MFNPEMMKMASEMMSKMSPEQLAQIQRQAASMPPEMMQQAMNMAQNATPEQMRQMQQAAASMPPDVLASQAGAAMDQLSSQQKYQYDAAMQLKAEGNKLHGSRQYSEAAEKYERAVYNLAGHNSAKSVELRVSCQSNLASCFLQLQQWQQCADMCNTVLAADASNRKALYRKGQALCALGQYDQAVQDLRRALQLSPASEKGIIGEKLEEAQQKQRQASRGVIIEEVTEAAAGDSKPAGAAAAAQEGLVQSDTDDDMPDIEDIPRQAEPAVPLTSATAATAAAGPAPASLYSDPRAQQAAEMLKNPDMARQAAQAMSAMSDEQIASMVAQSGMPGVTPEMARHAAAMMRSMPPEQLSSMAAQAAAAGPGAFPPGMGAGFPAAPAVPPTSTTTAAPSAAAAAVPAVPPMAGGDQAAAAAEAMRQNPEMMKQAAAMMENMSEEQLASMASMMPGAPPGMKIDAAQMKMAAKMMSTMSPEDMERMTKMAASMQGGGGSGAAGGGAAAAGAAGGGGMPGMPAGFDPASMPPNMMAEMSKRMQDPEMLRTMKNMLKGMDPDSLASMMKQSGLNVTPEQARSMVDKLDGVSDKQLELIARVMGYVNAVVSAYRAVKAWVLSQGALALAILVLVVAILLRWLGWI